MMSTAVFGAGRWGKIIIRNLIELGDLAAVCDLDPSSLELLKQHLKSYNLKNIIFLSNIDEVWNIPNVTRVVVAVPPEHHYMVAMEALKHDMDVFIEKPFTTNTDEANRICELASANKKILMVGHLFHYHQAMPSVLEWVEKGSLGCLRKIETQRYAGVVNKTLDALWVLIPHDISIALRLMQICQFSLEEDSVRVLSSKSISPSLADTVTATAMFKGQNNIDQAVLEMRASWVYTERVHLIKVIFQHGMLIWDTYKDVNSPDAFKVYDFVMDGPNMTIIKRKLLPREYADVSFPLSNELKVFIKCCESREVPYSDGREGTKVVHVLQLFSKEMKK